MLATSSPVEYVEDTAKVGTISDLCKSLPPFSSCGEMVRYLRRGVAAVVGFMEPMIRMLCCIPVSVARQTNKRLPIRCYTNRDVSSPSILKDRNGSRCEVADMFN